MSTIRRATERLLSCSNLFRKWWHQMIDTSVCGNCGVERHLPLMTKCRLQSCVAQQNIERSYAYTDDEAVTALMSGKRIYTTEGRSLCFPCSQRSGGICYVCELEIGK